MGPKNLTDQEKARILAFHEENVPVKEICRRTGKGKTAVYSLISRAKNLPPNEVPPRQSVPGRPRKTSPTTDKLIKRAVLKNPKITARQLKLAYPSILGNVAERTIQHRCQRDLKLHLRSATSKPVLTRKMRVARLNFAKKYKDFTIEDWRRVMWSDESIFQCGAVRRGKLRRPPGMSPLDPRYLHLTVKHPPSVMIWGSFSGGMGRRGIHFLPKNVTMNGDCYIEVLQSHTLNFYEIGDCNLFMQDNAPCHKAKKVTKWLEDKKVDVLEWPGNSPDLNPIEELWAHMKLKLQERDTSTLPCLVEALRDIWVHDIHVDYCRRLSDSMPRHIKAILKARGGHTKY